MSEELKPVRCGCGGEAKLYTGKQIVYTGEYLANVRCKKCGIAIPVKVNIVQAEAEAEAVTAWNRVMGATDTNVGDKERTTIVWKPAKGRPAYEIGICSCGYVLSVLQRDFVYCPMCGARLEWV